MFINGNLIFLYLGNIMLTNGAFINEEESASA